MMGMKIDALSVMSDAPVIPVIVLNDVGHAVALARALMAGGIRMLEVTLRTTVALDCIRQIAQEVPEAVVGAGTVCSARDIEGAVGAGASFLVSPGYTSTIGKAALQADIPLLPGVATASEIMMASEDGYRALKFFPALQSGGVALLKAFQGPFAQTRFCPTGGINADNAKDFLALSNVVCVGGSWLVPDDALVKGDYDRVTALARQAAGLHRAGVW